MPSHSRISEPIEPSPHLMRLARTLPGFARLDLPDLSIVLRHLLVLVQVKAMESKPVAPRFLTALERVSPQ